MQSTTHPCSVQNIGHSSLLLWFPQDIDGGVQRTTTKTMEKRYKNSHKHVNGTSGKVFEATCECEYET